MSQPDYVPLQDTDRVRPSAILPPPAPWYRDRPAETSEMAPPKGKRFGATGPDLGYGLVLARRLADRVELRPGEHRKDAMTGCFACGSRRAASFGRAPVVHDMEWAYTLWGFFGGASKDLLAWREAMFRGAAESYWTQRGIVDAVRDETLPLTAAQVRERLGSWKELLIR